MKDNVNIFETATKDQKFSTFTKAINAAGLAEMLKGAGPLTLFAPTDEAFAKLSSKTMEDLLKPENKERLTKVLQYHVVPGKLLVKDFKNFKEAKTMQGQHLKIDAIGDSSIQVNNAKVLTPALEASNGIILPVDTVLMPQAAAAATR